jgi:uncharacterized protein (TIGR00369 family)
MVKLDADGIRAFFATAFPQAERFGFAVDRIADDGITLSLPTTERHLRPGGTVSGPTLMTLADTAMYVAVLSQVGPEALAVTSNLEMHFLRKPSPGRLRAEARLLKLGRRLAVGTVEIFAETGEMVAYATVTYARAAQG